MLEIEKQTLLNIDGGAYISAPTYYLFIKLYNWVVKKISACF